MSQSAKSRTGITPRKFMPEDLQNIDQPRLHLLGCFVDFGVNPYLGLFSCIGVVHSAYSTNG